MSLVISDRVKETTTTSGTGSITLGGAVGGFVSFSSAIGEGNQTYYVIENDTRWEIGIGTVSSGALSRDTVLSSSTGSKIDLSGVSFVFVALPSSKTIVKDENDSFNLDADITTDNILVEKYALLNNVTSSGEIISSGFLTMTRTGAGNFFHAYVDDSNDRTISLYSDASSAPEWKLGLKSNPNSSGDPPTYAYIHAEDGSIGLYGNSQNTLSLSHAGGFILTNKSDTMITSSSNTGTVVNAHTASYPVFIAKAATSQSANIQEWQNSDGTVLSSLSSDGSLTIKGSDVLSSISANTSSGVAISGWAKAYVDLHSHNDAVNVSGALQPQITQNAEDIVTVSGLTSAGVDALPHVSGEYFLQLIDDNTVSGVTTSGYIDYAVSSGAAFTVELSGALQPQISSFTNNILANSASGNTISGIVVDTSGWNKYWTNQQISDLDRMPHASGYHFLSEIRLNSASGATNLDSILATSGYFDEVLGSGSYLGIIPTAVSGYIDYAIGSGATYTDTSINYISSVLYASGLDIGVSGIQSSGDLVIDGNLTLGSSGIATASGMSIGVSGLRFSDGTTQTTAATGGSARSVAGDTDNAIITWVTSDDTFAAESSLTFDGTTLTSNSGQFGGNVQIDGTANANSLAVSGNASIDGNLTVGSSGIVTSSGVSVGASGLRFSDGTTQTTAPTDTNTTYTAGSGLTLDGLNKFHATFASSGVSTSGVELKPISSDVLHSSGDRLFHEDGMLKFAGHILTSGAATVGEIDHDALTNFVSNEHVDHTSVTLTAGDGLTGGGDISSNRTFAVGAGTLIDVQADVVDVDLSEAAAQTIAHGDNLIFLDGGATGAASKGSTDDLATLLAGTSSSTGLSSSNSVLTVADLHPVGVDGSANQLLTDDGDGTVTSQANLTFDGSTLTYVGYLGSGLTIANDGSINASGDITTSGTVSANGLAVSGNVTIDGNLALGSSGTLISSGISVSGVNLGSYVPANTANALYNDGGTLKFNGSAVGGGGGSARSVSGDEDDAIITWKTSDNTFVAESNFTFDGSTLKIITGDTRFSVTNEGYVFASGDVTSSGTVISSGVSTSGVHLPPIAATALHSSGNQLFHEDGMLKFAGHILTSGAATVGEIDHDALTNFVANEHVDHTSVTLTAGDGLTGGGDISSNRTFAVGAGTLIDVQADVVDVDLSEAAAQTIAHGDHLIFLDGGDAGAASKGSTDDLATLLAGTSSSTGLSSSNSVLTIADLHPVGVDGSANQLLTDDGDGTVTSESKLTFDGSILKVILGDTRFSVTDEGYVFASGDVTSSGTVISSGVSTSGVHLPPIAATTLHSSGNQLFHENGMLKFAGHILTSGAATVGEIDHDALTNFVGNEHIDHTSVTLTAGDGLTGGGTIASNRTFAVGAGTLIDVQADVVDVDLSEAAAQTIAHGDHLIFLDGGDAGAASKGSTDDLATLLAGTSSSTGLSSSNSVLTIADLHPVGVDGSANQLLTDDGDGTVTSEANLTFDGSLNLINGHTRFSVANDGSVTASGDITTSGIVNASGMSVSGLYLANYVPTSTTNRLYNEGGTLKFNGSAVGGGGGSARSVAGDTDNGVITWKTSDNTFITESALSFDGTILTSNSGQFGGNVQIDGSLNGGTTLAMNSGEFGGNVSFDKSINQPHQAASLSSNVLTFDCSESNYFEGTINAQVNSIVFTNASAGQRIIMTLTNSTGSEHLKEANGWDTITINGNSGGDVKWAGGIEPVLTTNGVDMYGIVFSSTVTAAYGFIVGQDIKA